MAQSNGGDAGSSPNGAASRKEQEHHNEKVGLRKRLKHFTWAWFLSTMSTGALSIAIGETPHQFNGMFTSLFPYPL